MKRDRLIRFKTNYPRSAWSKEISDFKVPNCTFKELLSKFRNYNNRFEGVFEIVSHGVY